MFKTKTLLIFLVFFIYGCSNQDIANKKNTLDTPDILFKEAKLLLKAENYDLALIKFEKISENLPSVLFNQLPEKQQQLHR